MKTLALILALLPSLAVADVTAGLVAQYKMDGNGNDARGLYNLTTVGTVPYAAGRKGLAAGVFGAANYFTQSTAGLLSSLSITAGVTVSHWVLYPTNPGGTRVLWAASVDASNYYREQITTDAHTVRFNVSGTVYTYTANAVSLARWNHIALVLTNGACVVYTNGISNGGQATISVNGALTAFNVGSALGGAGSFPDYLDDFRIYNRALSAGEIANIYASSLRGPYKPNLLLAPLW